MKKMTEMLYSEMLAHLSDKINENTGYKGAD